MVHPILAAILSFIIPGLGQVVAGDIKKGIVLFIGILILEFILSLIFRHWIVWIIRFIYRLYTAFDAYNMAQ